MLTKSDLLAAIQCVRRLWLEKRRPDLIAKDDPALYRRAVDGQIVGQKARELLGKDVIFPKGHPDPEKAASTGKSMLEAAPNTPAVEFPMFHESIYARADALVPEKGAYALRETKSSTFPLKQDKITPSSPKDHHLLDLAIQLWVMEAVGIPHTRAELNLLNGQWRYGGDGNYTGLFRLMDVTHDVVELKSSVPDLIKIAKATLAGGLPKATTGPHCKSPNECPFLSHCLTLDPTGPEHPIELLPGPAGKALAKRLKKSKGYTSLLEPTPEELTGDEADLFRRIQKAHRTGETILEPGGRTLLEVLSYPRYYFDFEGIDLPVPRWKGVKPYEQVPFQWSCHIETSPGQFKHEEFLDLSGNDPSPACIQRMFDVLKPEHTGPIFVYSATYERTVLSHLVERFPDQKAGLEKLIARLYDLLPVVRANFYHPSMKASFSIKKVLPVIAPDLDYGALDEVTAGTSAQVAYLYAVLDPGTSVERKADLEAKLRKYCTQDTWAMVEVAHYLVGTGRPARPSGM